MADKTDATDPTVYVPYRVRIELVRARPDPDQPDRMLTSLEQPANDVTLTASYVFIAHAGGRQMTIMVEDLRSMQVEASAPPPDYASLREQYPKAYDPWNGWVLNHLRTPGVATTLGELADQTGRPPHHLVIKAREIGCHIPPDHGSEPPAPPPDEPTARIDDPFLTDHYLVHVGAHDRPPPKTADVLARHDVLLHDVYRIDSWGFAAYLAPDTAKRIAADPDVLDVEPDTGERLAPHHRMPVNIRVPGEYIVSVRRTSRPTTVAARAGVVPDHVSEISNWFFAELTHAQLHALRRDPEVDAIEDNATITLD